MKTWSTVLGLVILSGAITACGGSSNPVVNNAPIGGTPAVLDHNTGFDFSTGATTPDPDGDTIGWQPDGGSSATYPSNTTWVWWRTSTGGVNETRDLGAVTLASVTQAPATWEAAPDITPLIPGHVYVVRAKDGYAKFVVTGTPDPVTWDCPVNYVYSTTATFP